MNFFLYFLIHSAFDFLTQGTRLNQALQPIRHRKMRVPGIIRQRIAHGIDDMRQRIQSNHISGAECGAFRASNQGTRERIDQVKTKIKCPAMMHGSQQRKYANAIGDKIRRILGTNHALAQISHEKCFQIIEHVRIAGLTRNQFDQMHIARGVEKMDTAKPMTQCLRKSFCQLIDG